MLNSYIWGLYKQAEGAQVISMFQRNLTSKPTRTYAEEIKRLQIRYTVEDVAEENYTRLVSHLTDPREYFVEEYNPAYVLGTAPLEEVYRKIDAVMFDLSTVDEDDRERSVFQYFINVLSSKSTALAFQFPGLFTPYYFIKNYNVLTSIADTFGMDLPEIPKKSDFIGRVRHYGELCKSFYRFRQENGLTFYEYCAFLYDFAPQCIGGKDSYLVEELPDPKSAFFAGGGAGADASAENEPNKIFCWQCNTSTRAGDMVVMYLLSPISAISSVWRSRSVGFIDPFFLYYHCTYVGNPVKGSRIPLKDIKEDPVLREMPITKKNMQGVNGVELRPSVYNHIVDLTGAAVQKLEYVPVDSNDVYENEKAVEEHLIKPLLTRLGYSETEYIQQMYIEFGNHNHSLIPDFVIHPKSAKGHYSGDIVIEAKRSITNNEQLDSAKAQVRSYAKQLGARYAVIASQEKIWVMQKKDDYSDCVFENDWKSLDGDVFYAAKQLIGS